MQFRRLLAIISVALTCAMMPLCTREESASAFDSALWTGTNPSQMLNNDTNEMTFKFLSCDKVERVIEMEKVELK